MSDDLPRCSRDVVDLSALGELLDETFRDYDRKVRVALTVEDVDDLSLFFLHDLLWSVPEGLLRKQITSLMGDSIDLHRILEATTIVSERRLNRKNT